jgi:membrane-associated protease RseP (regulator of RpoE activity)
MLIIKQASLLLLAVGAGVEAQRGDVPCPTGPGAAFGIVAYQCANCGFKQEAGQRAMYTFFAEPVVTQVDGNAVVENGDVIEAVNGQPITTQVGADQFAYPTTATNTLTIRRGRDKQTVEASVPDICAVTNRVRGFTQGARGGFARGGQGGGARGARGAGGPARPGGAMRRYLDGQFSADSAFFLSDSLTGRFGFAVACRQSCQLRIIDGEPFTTYTAPPEITAVRPGSAADRAGMRVGDVISRVNGNSIVSADGLLQRAVQNEQIKMTVHRDGKDIDVLMLVTR